MKVKQLKELLDNYPEEMELLIIYRDNYGENIVDDFSIYNASINHCNFTTKFQSNIDYYSSKEDVCVYKDQINGMIQNVELPMEKKEVVILEC